TVSRTGDTTKALTVFYTISGSTTNGVDYQTIAASTVIPAGQSQVQINVTPLDDSISEGNETVVLTLNANSSYALTPAASATVTIADNDPPAPQTHVIVVAAGGQVQILDATTRALRGSFAPFAGYAGQLNVALGDFNADGVSDLVVSASF